MIIDHPTTGGIHIFDDFIDVETAETIEKILIAQPKKVQTELTDDGVNYFSSTKDDRGNEYKQPSLVITNNGQMNEFFNPIVKKIHEHIELIWARKVGLENRFDFCGYQEGDRLNAHYDGLKPDLPTPAGYESRDVSSVLYLNSGFTGGVLNFPNLGVSISPKRGMLALFPSSETYTHYVTAVESGVRFFVTQFWCLQ
jgi:predicted 2-oxoglutarate/Fe(II)-dependent dioxygenase YbiX